MFLATMSANILSFPSAFVSRSSIYRNIWAFLAAVALTTNLHAQSDYANQYTFSTLAGTALKSGFLDATGTAARFSGPYGVAVDTNGNVYVADTFNHSIRKITSAGVVTTLAGGGGTSGSADGTGSSARFYYPQALAVDGSGNVFVADTDNNTIRKITSSGVVTTIAGSPGVSGSADGTGSAALFYQPSGIAVDANGNLYVADSTNCTIRVVTSSGVVTTLAGTPRTSGSTDGTGSAALFGDPVGITVDSNGNLYVADGNSTIRKISSAGVVTTLAGVANKPGSADGKGIAASFFSPRAVTADSLGNLYVADTGNNTIRMITTVGVVTTLAGSTGTVGSADGTGSAALFNQPQGIAVDSNGNLYVADTSNYTIRKGQLTPPTLPAISTQPVSESVNVGAISTFSVSATGVPLPSYQWQLNGTNVSGATGPTLTIANTQLADAGIYTVVVTNGSGSVTSSPATLAVTVPITYSATTLATLPVGSTGPNGVAVDSSGTIYVTAGNAVEKVTSSGTVTLLAGSLTASGSADGMGAAASFNKPTGIATDSSGNVYVADSGNNSIRKVTPIGAVTTLAGLIQGNADGVGVAAQFDDPTAVALDSSGNVYVADTGNNELRKITPNGTTTTLLSGSTFTFANEIQPYSSAYSITGVAVDGSGNLYIGVAITIPFGHGDFPADIVSVLKVTSTGTYTVLFQVADYAALLGSEPGDGSLAIDGNGNFYVLAGDALFQGANLISSLIGTPLQTDRPLAIATDSKGLIYVANPPAQAVEVVTPVGSVPNIATQPTGGTIAYGADLTLSVAASATPAPTYQWQVDGVNIAGATSSSYTTSTPGTYTVVLTNSAGSVTSSPAVITAATRLINISSRAFVGTNANIEIAGFVISGPPGTTEQVLVRGVGPTLSQFGVTGFLTQPVLTLFNSAGNQVATNTGWNSASNAAQIAAAFTTTGAFAFPLDSADSALLVSLPPGAYTAEINGLNSTTGVALAEVYEVKSGDPELINISTRAFVNTGSNVEIGGFVVKGSHSAKVLVRAIGPTLSQFGVSGVLAQPSLSVVDSSGNTVASNTGWSTNANPTTIATEMAAVGAFALPSGSADSVLLLTLPPGSYTAVVSGINGTSGVALVEVYEAP